MRYQMNSRNELNGGTPPDEKVVPQHYMKNQSSYHY